jgi:hypothetical protein
MSIRYRLSWLRKIGIAIARAFIFNSQEQTEFPVLKHSTLYIRRMSIYTQYTQYPSAVPLRYVQY